MGQIFTRPKTLLSEIIQIYQKTNVPLHFAQFKTFHKPVHKLEV